MASKKWERALVVLFESQSVIRIGTLLQESVGKRTLRVAEKNHFPKHSFSKV